MTESLFRRAISPSAFTANAVAQMLSHGCAIASEQAAKIPSFRALRYAWAAEGYAYNDALEPNERWRAGLTGWDDDPVYDNSPLKWATPSRLRFRTGDGGFTLILSSGDEPDFLEVRGVYRRADDGNSLDVSLKAVGGATRLAELLQERADRVSYVWRLDYRLDGAISEALLRYHDTETARVLLDAKGKRGDPAWYDNDD